ncbi:Glyoxalase-like domain-containing protein [Chryseolinea serpens]|uniref:Glyoxalase-like domain-containing protein n=1 Tax=Chryseolinea serpens TaxID=947013 RepID=A0A1M5TQK9_9BACT|nr:VOC family protein [Chryseolinea serpens]SHH53052.1 Glyoxalase-like domain-containing protein [Chryseolinea serpens]
MKKLILIVGVLVGILGMLAALSTQGQPQTAMKVNVGIITPKLKESKDFYTNVLKYSVAFENDFYILMHAPDNTPAVAFLLPNHPTQQPVFQPAFQGAGMFFTIEVRDVDAEFRRIKSLGIPIAIELRDEPWGDRHFAVVDPNGVGIDFVTYKAP